MRSLLLLLLASCAATSSEKPQLLRPDCFSTPTNAFTIPARGENSWSMERVLLEYGRATNQRFLYDEVTRSRLLNAEASFEDPLVVTPKAMHSVVGALLVEFELVLTITQAADPRFVAVSSVRRTEGDMNCAPFLVSRDELSQWREFTAHYIQTSVQLDSLDVVATVNSLERTLSEEWLQRIVALGSTSTVLVSGLAPWVNTQVDMLDRINATAAAANSDLSVRE